MVNFLALRMAYLHSPAFARGMIREHFTVAQKTIEEKNGKRQLDITGFAPTVSNVLIWPSPGVVISSRKVRLDWVPQTEAWPLMRELWRLWRAWPGPVACASVAVPPCPQPTPPG